MEKGTLDKQTAIQELNKGLDLLSELWFVADDQSGLVSEICGQVSQSINAALSCLESEEAMGKGTKRSRSEEPSPRDQSRRPELNVKKAITDSPFGDGYQWRKYGQKNIQNAQHPRCYYRCTYSGCKAKKRVQQRTVGFPAEYEVTLTEEHTCNTQPMPLWPARGQHLICFESNESNQGMASDYNISSLQIPQHSIDEPLSPTDHFYGTDAGAYMHGGAF